jgi:hypothetical protein
MKLPRRQFLHLASGAVALDADGKVVVRRQIKRRYVLAFFTSYRPA